MATIKATLRLYDGMARPLRAISSALDAVISGFETVQRASANAIDVSNLRSAREELSKARTAFDDIESEISQADAAQKQFNSDVRNGGGAAGNLKSKLAGLAATDYITAKYSNAISIIERAADHAAYCCVTDGAPTPGGVLLHCLHARPTRDIHMLLRVEHGGTSGYMVMTGQAQPSGGTKTANGSVITAEQAVTVTELGFRPAMVTFVGSSGKTTVTSGYGADTGSTTIARYADATGPANVGTFSPSDDGFTLTVQGADTKTINVGWQAVGS